MNNATTPAQSRNLDQILDEGNIQSFITKNKSAVIAFLVLLIGGVISFGLYRHFNDKSQDDYNTKIYNFETTVMKAYEANPTDAKPMLDGFAAMAKEMDDYVGLVPVTLKVTDLLAKNNHLAETKQVLAVGEAAADNDYASYFVLSRKAAIQEDLGENKEAIETLNKLVSHSTKILEAKTYVDLGRLYLKTGDKEKARASFKYVIDNNKEEAEFVKIAQLYLAKI
jgi:predicted negative regulator of RcsB-dependent stress response